MPKNVLAPGEANPSRELRRQAVPDGWREEGGKEGQQWRGGGAADMVKKKRGRKAGRVSQEGGRHSRSLMFF